MVHECEHFYETGRKCRRITKRGDAFCPGHRPDPRRSVHDDPQVTRKFAAFADQLREADSLDLFCSLQDALTAIQPLIERKSSRAAYLPFARAVIAVAVVVERLITTRQAQNPAVSNAGQRPPFRST